MTKILKITVLLLFSVNLSAQQILREGGRLLTGTTTGQVAVFNAGTGTWSAGTDQNGIYTGNGTVPNGTTATLANDFTFSGTDNTGTQDPALRVTATGTNPGIVSFIVSTDSVMLSRVSGEFRQTATGPFRLQADGLNILSNDGLTLQGDSLILQAGVTEDVTQNTVLSINTATNRVRRKPMHLSQTVSYGSSSIQASRTVVYVNNIAAAATITLPDPATNVNNPVTIARYDATSVGTITITTAGTPLIEDLAAYTYGTSTTLGTDAGNRRATFMSDGTRYHIVMTGGAGGGGGGSSTTTLDDAYNNFAATASTINVDAAQGQTGGLTWTMGTPNFTINLNNTGDFQLLDAGASIFRALDNGYSSFGAVTPSTAQKLGISEAGAGTAIVVPLRIESEASVTDAGGVKMAMAFNGGDRLSFSAYNPSGSYNNAAAFTTTSGDNIVITDDIRETRFMAATAHEVTSGSATTYQVTGLSSVIYIPSSATTTTVNLPEIVTGAAGANQVNPGYLLEIYIDRSVQVTINRGGAADTIMIDGQTSTATAMTTTAGTFFCKKLRALAADRWGLVQ